MTSSELLLRRLQAPPRPAGPRQELPWPGSPSRKPASLLEGNNDRLLSRTPSGRRAYLVMGPKPGGTWKAEGGSPTARERP